MTDHLGGARALPSNTFTSVRVVLQRANELFPARWNQELDGTWMRRATIEPRNV
jgi:hypothetical protein